MKRASASKVATSARNERDEYVLRLYVAGMTPRSRSAIESITSICKEYLEGRYDLEVIDVFQRPVLAREEQIIATPTLVKRLPAPLRRFIGDLSQKEKVLVGLDLRRQG
jgi:circadian clock protein KaiB